MKQGEIFDNRYKIVKTLGKGGMSTVYLAENVRTGGLWAIKEILKKSEKKIDIRSEFNILKKLKHEALPIIFDIIEDDTYFYIVEDFIEGISLDYKLKNKTVFSEENVINFARELCEVLRYLHNMSPNPVIYRDMKPSNIILTTNGKLKLIDFGIAREYKDESLDDTVYIGTRGYAAPEQYGLGQTSERTDIYNLGMTLHHLITGQNPNSREYVYRPIRQFNETLSEEFEKIIEKCTAGDPDERYQNIEEVQYDLKKIISDRKEKSDDQPKQEQLKINFSPNNCRKLMFSCFGNGEFAAELSYYLAKTTGMKVLLIDLNFEKQKIDLCLNLICEFERKLKNGIDFGILNIQKAIERKQLNAENINNSSVKGADLKNLYVLINPFDCKNISVKTEINMELLLKASYKYYDFIIISQEDFSHSEYTKNALEHSDFNFVAVSANIDKVREYWGKIKYLSEKYDIQKDKNKFVAFEYKENINLSPKNIKKFVGKNNYLGLIPYNIEREKCVNFDKVFVQRHFNEIKGEYLKILKSN